MKKLLLTLSLLLVLVTAQAQTIGTWVINSNVATNLLITGPLTITRVTVSAFGSVPVFTFYDYNTNASNPFGTFQYSNTVAYSNLVFSSPVTNSVVFTNSLGRQATNQYVGLTSIWTVVAAATASNSLPIGAFAVQSGIPYTVDVNWNVVKGLSVLGSNNASSAIIIEYH